MLGMRDLQRDCERVVEYLLIVSEKDRERERGKRPFKALNFGVDLQRLRTSNERDRNGVDHSWELGVMKVAENLV